MNKTEPTEAAETGFGTIARMEKNKTVFSENIEKMRAAQKYNADDNMEAVKKRRSASRSSMQTGGLRVLMPLTWLLRRNLRLLTEF